MIEQGILGDMAELVVSATKGEINVNAMAEVAVFAAIHASVQKNSLYIININHII